jgi:hypothetical protein
MMRLYAHYAALSRVTASTAARPMSDPWYDTSDYVYPEGDMWGFKRIDAAYAWALSNGDGVTVAVLDSGIDMLHSEWWGTYPDNNIWVNPDPVYVGGRLDIYGVNYCSGPDPVGVDTVTNYDVGYNGNNGGHGTFVSGIIAAREDGVGMNGLAPEADIMSLKVLGTGGDTSDIALAIRYAADHGAKVINMSLGVEPGPAGSNYMPAVLREAIDYAFDMGCLLVAAAGNDAEDAASWIPARDMKVLGVAATMPPESGDDTASFSNYGSEIDVAAPGAWIVSLRSAGTDMYLGSWGYTPGDSIIPPPNGAYYMASGTSMSAAFVSGLAALIWSKDLADHGQYTLTNDQVMNLIRFSADDLGSPGMDAHYGYGLIDAYHALTKVFDGSLIDLSCYMPLETGTYCASYLAPDNVMTESLVVDSSTPGIKKAAYTEPGYTEYDYIAIDSGGCKLYGFDVDWDGDGLMDIAASFGPSGLLLCDAQVEIGRTYYAEGLFSHDGVDYLYSRAMTVNGFEDTVLDTGVFINDALKVTIESTLEMLNGYGDSVTYRSSTRVSWNMKGFGEVKNEEVEISSSAEKYNARNGVTYYPDSGHYKKSELLDPGPGAEYVYFEYLNEDFAGRGYGRIGKARRADGTYEIPYEFYAGTDKMKSSYSYNRQGVIAGSRRYEYWPGTGNIRTVLAYDTEGDPSATYEYYQSGAIRSTERSGTGSPVSESDKLALYDEAYPYIKYFLDRANDDLYEIGDANKFAFNGLTNSYQIDLGSSVDEKNIIDHAAVAYDQAVLGLISLYSGDTTILDTYVDYLNQLNNVNNPLINSSNIYQDGSGAPLKYGLYRMARIEGRDASHGSWYNQWDWSVDTGAAAYFIMYASEAYGIYGKDEYRDFAVMLGDHILRLQDSLDGGVRYGPRGMGPAGNPDLYWNKKSTEQNENSLKALEMLFDMTGDSRYALAASGIRGWLKTMYDKSEHLYAAAADYISGAWHKATFDYMPADVIAFAPLEMMFSDSFFGADEAARQAEVDAMFDAIKPKAFLGPMGEELFFSFTGLSRSLGYGSVEWSSQMALAYLESAYFYLSQGNDAMADKYLTKYNTLMASLQDFFIPSDDPLAKVAPYASYFSDRSVAAGRSTGTGYTTLNCQAALASSCYALALIEGLKPWRYEYEDGQIAREILTNGKITSFDIEELSGPFILSTDIDNNGQKDLVIDFGDSYGIWIYNNNSTWTQLHTVSSKSILSTDIDNNGQKDLVIDFGDSYGIWIYNNNSTWTQLHTISSKSILSTDIDNNGQKDLVIDFGGLYGIWIYNNNSTWTQLHTVSSKSILSTDIDNNGQKDLVIDFGDSYGIWIYNNNSTWTQLHTISPYHEATGLSIYLPRGDEGLAARMSLESTLTQDNSGTNYTQVGTLADPPKSDSLSPRL